ncbi:serine/threonine-protein kinase [Streptomyces neyagawaensis]|uniref:serine/threonine-protein kinase n=1 Tax=Streptomyces neyagawaensis TaxID=42238 RepID=UPI00201D2380|nr:serine/threonine-protein kinase [Streptomyces neyagawaensis]MCL6738307.1 serine/threonine protein kinase [Streptomyces neyagawaensis]MDE1688736.1 serine/threonine-protein kinase [Streptomyces neyagawaensis]
MVSDVGRLVAGRYRLTEQIGRGGMGTVWRGEDEVLGRQVALKQLHVQPHLAPDDLARLYERTRREARSAARVAHPNVIVVHDVVDDEVDGDGRPCIVMEYVPAPTLADLLTDGRTVPPEEAARIGLGMIAALRAAHAAGVLHRDVKPGNVLLGADGRVVLTDFGIAMTADASTLTKTGEMVGSIHYMAPERIRGQKPGPASDLWALGATLYQAVEGRPPFRRLTAMEAAYAIAVDPLEPLKQGGALEPLIEALLVKDPEERPTAEQTEQALRAVLSGTTTTTLPGPSATGAPGPYGRHGDTDRHTTVAVGHTLTRPGPEPGSGPGRGTHRDPEARARRGRRSRRRVLVTLAVAVTVAATVIGATLYAASNPSANTTPDGGADGSPTPSYSPPPVPDGYHLVKDKSLDVSFPVPDGWTVSQRTSEGVVHIDGTGLVRLEVGMVDPAGSHPMAHFKDIEANTKLNYPGSYRKLRMQKTTLRGQPAAVWEFTFRGRARTFRAIDVGFGREGEREYDIYLSAPDLEWDTYRPVFDKVRDGFITSAS